MRVNKLYKFDELWNIKSEHYFDNRKYFISNFGRLKYDNKITNNKYNTYKTELVNAFIDNNNNRERFKRHQIVAQTFLEGEYVKGYSPDHINRFERFDNSVFNLRWASRDIQCINRDNIGNRNKEVKCLNNNIIYRSCAEAERDLNLTFNTVAPVARGEKSSVFGYKFTYVTTIK